MNVLLLNYAQGRHQKKIHVCVPEYIHVHATSILYAVIVPMTKACAIAKLHAHMVAIVHACTAVEGHN